MQKDLQSAIDYQQNYERYVGLAAQHIKERIGQLKPSFGVVLGSGLGNLVDSVQHKVSIPYNEIPYFPQSTVQGHEGILIAGKIEKVDVLLFKGRKHYYEVADKPFNTGILEVVFPVHTLANLNVKNYFATNAAGGLNPNYEVGDMMVISSHINQIPNPLLGKERTFQQIDGKPCERFPPMHNAYSPLLRKLLMQSGMHFPHFVHEGVYLAVTGPTYETEAESIAYRDGLFADAVGMSTAPEVIVARSRGMSVVGFSCITNVIAKDGTNATNHEEVQSVLQSNTLKDKYVLTLENFFRSYSKNIK